MLPLSMLQRDAFGTTAADMYATVQMTAISLLLASSSNNSSQALQLAAALGVPLLCVATFLTLWSLADYMRGVWPYM